MTPVRRAVSSPLALLSAVAFLLATERGLAQTPAPPAPIVPTAPAAPTAPAGAAGSDAPAARVAPGGSAASAPTAPGAAAPAAPSSPPAAAARVATPAPEEEEDLDEGLGEPPMPPTGYLPGHRERQGLGLSPHVPGLQSVLPAAIAPAFGAPYRPQEGSKLEFHGYLQGGGRAGFNSRSRAREGQEKTVWHGDPLVPRGNVFENTNVVPYTWAELRFAYVTPMVTATISLGAWDLSEAMESAGSFMPNAQLWVRDAFLTYQPRGLDPVKLTWKVGVYEDRYGWMAEYSSGQYGAPLIATIPGVGETLSASLPIGKDWVVDVEHGIKSNLDRPPADLPVGPTNNWAKPWEGQTFVNHLHLGAEYAGMIRPALHYIQASSRDDTGDDVALGNLRAGYAGHAPATPTEEHPELDHADGSLQILAADVSMKLKRFGHLYLGVSHVTADRIRTVSGVVQILNAGGGRDLMDRYFGRNNDDGRGRLLLAGAEYTVSLGELLRYPDEFFGEGPDLKLTLYGMYAHITADDPARDGEDKYKLGIEGTYSFLSWLAMTGRIDRAVPYAHAPKALNLPPDELQRVCGSNHVGPKGECLLYPNQNDNSYTVLTAKAVFKSGWSAREALTVQYSRFLYRSDFHLVTLNSGGQVSNQTDQPDEDLLAVFGTLWW